MQDMTTSEILIPREISDRFRLWRDIKRTAVLGTEKSGKSVFLTSIIDRLNRLNGKTAKMGTGTLTGHIDRLPPDEGAGGFPLRTYRNNLRAQEWPDKTVALSEYNYRFYRTGDGPVTRGIANLVAEERSFLDLPGERLTDFSMAQKSYAQWSDALFETFGDRRSYASLVQDYLQLLPPAAAGPLEEAAVLTVYKKVLARFARRLIPMVSPSTFLVYDHDMRRYPKGGDKPAHEMTIDELVQRGVCGLDATNEFAPLSKAAREANPELAHRFAARFTTYRDTLAEPLATAFYTSEHLLVLVDVVAILEGGPTVYDGTRQVLQRMLEYLDPGRSTSQVLSDLAKKVSNIGAECIDQVNRYLPRFLHLDTTRAPNVSRVSKVGFIVTKSDCVHSRDRANLRALLRQMTEELLQEAVRKRWLSVEYFSCAAIQATRDLDDYPYLERYLFNETKDEMEYRKGAVSPVPSAWPAESQWEQTKYRFAESRPPKLDLLGNRPFPSLGMEAVMRFIGWDGA
jgi:predicted YcjX-like family ATPase